MKHNRVKIKCCICGKIFDVIFSRKDKSKYCGRECYYKRKWTKEQYISASQRMKNLWKENPSIWEKSIEKTRERMIGNQYGKLNKGRKLSEKHKRMVSENHADVSGDNNPMFGKHHSKETKDKISNTKIEKGTHIGKKNGRWNGGKSFEPYSIEFNKSLKEEIRKRDGYTCQKCNKTEEEELKVSRRKLSIHHIDYNKKNNKKNNLITLCGSCNSIVNLDRIDWMHYFQNKLKQNE